MKKTLLFFSVCLILFFSASNRYLPVSLDRVQPTTKTVEIKGEVNNPGVYTMKWEATIEDLIEEAGGISENGSTDTLSLTKTLEDKDVVVIPQKQIEQDTQLISINSASAEQLETLPGIGPSIAGRIIEYRSTSSFQTLEDIKNVKGIGDKMFEKIKDLICL